MKLVLSIALFVAALALVLLVEKEIARNTGEIINTLELTAFFVLLASYVLYEAGKLAQMFRGSKVHFEFRPVFIVLMVLVTSVVIVVFAKLIPST